MNSLFLNKSQIGKLKKTKHCYQVSLAEHLSDADEIVWEEYDVGLNIWGQCYKTSYGRKLRLFIVS